MKLNNFIRSKKGIFILNFIILLTYALSGCMKYEVSDDFIMEMMVSGAYTGNPSPYIMFMNPIIGIFLSFLYNVFKKINWYFLFQIAVIFLSLCVLSYCFLKKKSNNFSILLVFVFLFFFSNDLYLLVQFTKTATVAISTGIILILTNVLSNNKRNSEIVIGFILFSLGVLIRRKCLYIGLFFSIIPVLYYIIQERNNKNKIILLMKHCIQIGIIGLLLLFSFNLFDTAFDKINSEYKLYQKYNSYRANIVDYNYYTYEENKEKFKEKGISENDFNTLVHWNFGDTDYYDIDMLKTVSTILDNYRSNQYVSIRGTVVNLINREYKHYVSVWGMILVFLIGIISNKKNILNIFLVSTFTFILLFINMYLGRLNYRVEYSIFLAATVYIILLLQISEDRVELNSNILKISIVLMIVFRVPVYIPNYENNYDIMFTSWNNDIKKYNTSFIKNKDLSVINEIQNNPNNFYYLGFYSNIQTLYLNFNPFKSIPTSTFNNAAFFAGVDTYHPDWLEHLNKNGIENPMKDLLKENVYFIENRPINEVLKFIQEHYKKDAEMILYKQIGSYYVWKIR